ncbi:hypothetical protein [Aquimarina aggregata]|uniref:hypothetical protein n=1 Tax=Aquimarina aggregata TaxID=1642818 RepID=UPI00248F6128|nr:hypothetical protein [Aquimarina aggregata]
MDVPPTYNALYRPLKKGHEFDNLLPSSKCSSTRLTKGDTDVTVDHMTDWVNKHYTQTVQLSPKLQRATLNGTVTAIYEFLYHHIQYLADGAEQQLRSPACAWKQRHIGVDCKSYSIFASSILKNLGIDHYIRKVKQPGFHPNQFTHVYIIVPKRKGTKPTSGNYYVIDATKHENTEVTYLEAKDIFMQALPHVGLNGAVNRTVNHALRMPHQVNKGFEDFLGFLKDEGASQNLVNALRKEVYSYLNMGIDPRFYIGEQGAIVEGKLFPYSPNRGLGEPITTGAIAAASKVVLKSDFFKKTIGAIFANGFDVSCWGSSYNPSKAKADVELDMPFILKFSGLETEINAENLATFLNLAEGYKADAQNGTRSRYAKCTRRGHELRKQAVDALMSRVLTEIRANFILTPTLKRPGNTARIKGGLPGYRRGIDYHWAGHEFQGYNVKPKEQTKPHVVVKPLPTNGGQKPNPNPTGGGGSNNGAGQNPINHNPNTGGSGGGSGQNPNTGGSGNGGGQKPDKPKAFKASFGWIAGGVLAAAALSNPDIQETIGIGKKEKNSKTPAKKPAA